MRPNLFEHATSELSQDAAICRLIAWADPKYADADPALHRLGKTLITELFSAAGVQPPTSIDGLKIDRQVEHVDIVVEVGAAHGIIIEDKVHASHHSGQLDRYAETFRRRYADRSLALIYLKVGDESSYGEVIARGWHPSPVRT